MIENINWSESINADRLTLLPAMAERLLSASKKRIISKARGKGRQQSAGPCLGGGKKEGTVPARATKIHSRVGLQVNSHLTLHKLEGWFASEHP